MSSSTPPNVVGYLLDEARAVLAEAGWHDVETSETRPPRRTLLPPYRVLRQHTAGTRVALVISGERSAAPEYGGAAPRDTAADAGAGEVATEESRT